MLRYAKKQTNIVSNISKKEHVKKYQRLREELEKMWRVKATVVLRGNQSTCCSDPQTGRFTDSKNDILCLEEWSPRNNVGL